MKRTSVILFSGLVFAMQAGNAAQVELKTQEDKLSYAMGIETGKAFQSRSIAINPKLFALGLEHGLKGGKPLLNDQQIKDTLIAFQKESLTKLQGKMKEESQKNEKLSADFLSKNKQNSGVESTTSGLQYKVVSSGSGAKPTLNDVVTVDYEGKTIDGKVFDSSYKRGQPATFPVSGVIKGWQEAIMMMPAGSTWEVYIPSNLAYGQSGAPGIGPNQLLIFKIHLISIKKPGEKEVKPAQSQPKA